MWVVCSCNSNTQECYCGNSFATGAALASDPTTCNMACAGNAEEMCGGANRLNVYLFPGDVEEETAGRVLESRRTYRIDILPRIS
jgi:hypothetical protein